MFELGSPALPADKARTLLRRLRDLNLTAGPIAVSRDLAVVIAGCLSLDGPAERGVRYRLRMSDGSERLLELGCLDAELELSLSGARADELRRIRVPLTCDKFGRACARALGARVSPETNDPRELEHFLKRVVRVVAR